MKNNLTITTLSCIAVILLLHPVSAQSLYKTINKGKFDKAREMIAEGSNLNERGKDGETPLILAIRKTGIYKESEIPDLQRQSDKFEELALQLIDQGAKINIRSGDGITALSAANWFGLNGLKRKLLLHGAKIRMEYDWLYGASLHGDPEITTALLEGGLKVNRRYDPKVYPLHLAAQSGSPKTVSLLLDHGADIHATGEFEDPNLSGFTALHFAAREGNLWISQLLIDRGAFVSAEAINNITPLHLAALNGHPDVVDVLLKEGADSEARTVWGETPLFLAASGGYEQVMITLLEEGAAIGGPGETADDHYALAECLKMKGFLASNGRETAHQDLENAIYHFQEARGDLKKEKRKNGWKIFGQTLGNFAIGATLQLAATGSFAPNFSPDPYLNNSSLESQQGEVRSMDTICKEAILYCQMLQGCLDNSDLNNQELRDCMDKAKAYDNKGR